jgi:hypothetical protein
MLEVGAVVTRKADGVTVRLVGIDGAGRWVAQPAEEFGPPFAVEVAELVEDYDVSGDPTPPAAVDEGAMREADRRANDVALVAYGRVDAAREPNDDQLAGAEALARTRAWTIFAPPRTCSAISKPRTTKMATAETDIPIEELRRRVERWNARNAEAAASVRERGHLSAATRRKIADAQRAPCPRRRSRSRDAAPAASDRGRAIAAPACEPRRGRGAVRPARRSRADERVAPNPREARPRGRQAAGSDLVAMQRVRCWRCGSADPSEGRTCDACRAKLAAESFCGSGDPCGERAGRGTFGSFCRSHALALAPLRLGRGLDKPSPSPARSHRPSPSSQNPRRRRSLPSGSRLSSASAGTLRAPRSRKRSASRSIAGDCVRP